MVKRDMVRRDVILRDMMRRDVVKRDVVRRDMVRRDMVKRDMVRRDTRAGFLLFLFSVAAAIPAAAQTCELAGGQKAESGRYIVAYRTKPEPVRIGQHFAMDFLVCPKASEPAPEGVRVDGYMPDHAHGMNYKAVVKAAGGGRYEASGMMFHMPGKWDFIFEIRGAGRTDRVTHSVMLQ